MENKQNFSVEITLSDANLMKLLDLSGKLGVVLGANPVWENGCVDFKEQDGCKVLSFDLDSGWWLVTTGTDYTGIYLPEEAPELMGKMSKLVKETESRHEK